MPRNASRTLYFSAITTREITSGTSPTPRHAEFLPKAVFDSCNDFHPDSSPFPYGISIAHPRPPVKGRKQKGISVSFAFGKRIFLG